MPSAATAASEEPGAPSSALGPLEELGMNGQVTSIVTVRSRSTTLAFASIAAWLAAAAITGPLGIWPAIGGAAIALGLAVLLFDRPASTALLQPSPRLVLLGAAAGGVMAVATYLL